MDFSIFDLFNSVQFVIQLPTDRWELFLIWRSNSTIAWSGFEFLRIVQLLMSRQILKRKIETLVRLYQCSESFSLTFLGRSTLECPSERSLLSDWFAHLASK